MAKYTLKVNGRNRIVDAEPDTPLLYVLRENLALKGPRFGCGLGQCGACTVHLDGQAARSCLVPLGELTGALATLAPKRPRFGCGLGQCAACTVRLDGKAAPSCLLPIGEVKGAITTLE